jgi:hypothetical protein
MADLLLRIMFFGGLPVVAVLWAWFLTLERQRRRQLHRRHHADRRC